VTRESAALLAAQCFNQVRSGRLCAILSSALSLPICVHPHVWLVVRPLCLNACASDFGIGERRGRDDAASAPVEDKAQGAFGRTVGQEMVRPGKGKADRWQISAPLPIRAISIGLSAQGESAGGFGR
jgi:hypothetical protein